MKTYLYPLLAGLLSLAACTNDTLQEIVSLDPEEEDNKVNLTEGTFIVDYSVDGDVATRAADDGKLKIRSLDYYVYYEEGGELVKHRRIMIDPDKQEWPMTRDNMTWEQRQFLQDTLQYDVAYRTLFIANVAPSLFNYDTYSESNPHPAVVIGDTLYQNARILLPNVPFHEDNYYCLWEGHLNNPGNNEAGHEELIKRKDVLLQRIVTRTDVRKTDNPTTLYKAIEDGFYKENCEEAVKEAVNKWINDFCNRINKCADYHRTQNIYNYKDDINTLTTELQTNKDKVVAAYKVQLINEYVNIIKSSSIYTTRMQNWYANGRTVKAIYRSSTRANALSFQREPSHYAPNDSEYNNEAFCTIDENGIVTLIGYHGQNGELNIVTSFEFSDFTITGTNATFTISQGINNWYETTCNPCAKVLFHSSTSIQEKTVNLLDIMTGISTWDKLKTDNSFKEGADYFWTCYLNHFSGNLYGDDDCNFEGYAFDRFPIKVTLPNLTADNVNTSIELIPSWAYEESGNQ